MKKPYTITGEKRFFSGREHVVVKNEKDDSFFLDTIFLFILEHADDDRLPEKAMALGIEKDELPFALRMLRGAGFIGE